MPLAFPTPPNAADLLVWMRGKNYDGSNNATLVHNQALPSIVNLGTVGGVLSTPAADPTLSLSGGMGRVKFASGDRLVTPATPGLTGIPLTIALIVKRTASGANATFFDGSGVSNRQTIGENSSGWLGLYSGIGITASTGTIQNKYNLIVVRFNGASSWIDLNQRLPDQLYFLTGNPGPHVPAFFTIGSQYDGGNPTIGEVSDALIWTGMPDENDIADFFNDEYNVGWAKTTLTNIQFESSYVTPPLVMSGGDKVSFVGDSITGTYNWYSTFVSAMNAELNPDLVVVNNGVPGDTISLIKARLPADVVAQSPKPHIVVMQDGVNDLFLKVPLDEFLADYQASIDILKVGIPGVLIACGDIVLRQEYYPDPIKKRIDQYNIAIASLCFANGLTYVPFRAAQQAYEAVNNLPPPGTAFNLGPLGQPLLSFDGVHPRNEMKLLMSNVLFGRVHGTAPTVAFFSPAAGTISPTLQIVVRATDIDNDLGRIQIVIADNAGTRVAYDNGFFAPYVGSESPITGGRQVSLFVVGNWIDGPLTATVFAYDSHGNLSSVARTWTVSSAVVEGALDYAAQAQGRVITQYRESAKLLAFLAGVAAIAQDIENVLVSMQVLDDYTTADGVNLDVDGDIVGQGRELLNGDVVDDAEYRVLIAAKITRNMAHATGEDMIAILFQLFNAQIVINDYGGMAFTFEVGRALTADEIAVLSGDILARPMGVKVNGVWFDPADYFGFAEDPNASGFADDTSGQPGTGGGRFAEDI